jgi:hypothetical protein
MRHLITVFFSLALMGTAGAAEIYCLQQNRDCSDRPTPGATVIRINGTQRQVSQPAPATTAGKAATTGDPVANQVAQNLAESRAKQAVQKDVNDKRTEQCKKAQDTYQRSIAALTLYRSGKDGERVVLSDSEADQARVQAKLDMEKVCNAQ